jgi:O-acetyl-ADP-ribose deacetylase (regulator of RNase III)
MNSKIQLIQADITTLEVDVIVNAANNSLMGGGGVDGAIHKAAGPALKEACRMFHGCPTGEARITNAFNLPSTYVIHAVGPVWYGGGEDNIEDHLLENVYLNSLQLALDSHAKSIAFPCISTGAFRFPFERAGKIALQTINNFLEKHPSIEEVFLVCFSDKNHQQYQRIIENEKAITQ